MAWTEASSQDDSKDIGIFVGFIPSGKFKGACSASQRHLENERSGRDETWADLEPDCCAHSEDRTNEKTNGRRL